MMRILLTNDDGIYAKGIEVLAAQLRSVAQVTVVAPDHERSAAGHAITLWDPLRVSTVDRNGAFFGYAVDGTPADCVKIAVQRLLKKKPDLVVSGINLGPNTGTNVIYSGTVSAALEGAVLGIPSMAVSLATFRQPRFAVAARVATALFLQLRQLRLPPTVVLNVNVPNCPLAQLKGVRVTCQSRSRWPSPCSGSCETESRSLHPSFRRPSAISRPSCRLWMAGNGNLAADFFLEPLASQVTSEGCAAAAPSAAAEWP